MGLILPELPPRDGIYKSVKQDVSGQGATVKGVSAVVGHVGVERTVEEGQDIARLCVMNCLATLHDYLGDLNRIKSQVKILGFVASVPGFNMQPKVMDGASKLFMDIFGEDNGVGARSAIGTNELSGGITVEVEFIFET